MNTVNEKSGNFACHYHPVHFLRLEQSPQQNHRPGFSVGAARAAAFGWNRELKMKHRRPQ
jgi:hypothetical protein